MQSKDKSLSKVRKFIRHPSDVPLRVSLDWVQDEQHHHPCEKLNNVSLGGLAFKSPRALPKDQYVRVCFPLLDDKQELTGKVVWNRKLEQGYEIGLRFEDPEQLFRLRMIEQICHIEHYRSQVEQQEQRQLTIEQAAKEWISLYADEFPSIEQ